jgi:hypothetical protein
MRGSNDRGPVIPITGPLSFNDAMANPTIASRLSSHRLDGDPLPGPVEVVAHLGAVQSQDYAAAKWAIAQRCVETTDAALDRLFDDGAFLRTHVMRPTWHFVVPKDLRSLLALTAPRVHAALDYYNRQYELDAKVLSRSHKLIAKALGTGPLTREQLGDALAKGGIEATGVRLAHILMAAELDALIVSGPRRGRQFTYALFDERVPRESLPARDEMLAAWVVRYFVGHGPATAADCAWWLGLTIGDVRAGIEAGGSRLGEERRDGRVYWVDAGATAPKRRRKVEITSHLLANYDEYIVAYKDRGAIVDPALLKEGDAVGDTVFAHTILVNGVVVGHWKRALAKQAVRIEKRLFRRLTKEEAKAVHLAEERYGRFLERNLER